MPEHLIDINDLDELAYIREQGDEIRIGALTRHVDLLESELLAERLQVFRDAEEVIADPVVRNRGTIGGSLCQADAAEDLSAVCSALKANVVIRGADGERVVSMSEFHVGPFMTAVNDAEILTEVRIPLRARSAAARTRRSSGGPATSRSPPRRLPCGSTAARSPRRDRAQRRRADHVEVTRAEELLRGKPPSDELFAQAGEIAAEDCSPLAGRPRPRRLQAPSRRRAHQTRPAPRERARPAPGGLNQAWN